MGAFGAGSGNTKGSYIQNGISKVWTKTLDMSASWLRDTCLKHSGWNQICTKSRRFLYQWPGSTQGRLGGSFKYLQMKSKNGSVHWLDILWSNKTCFGMVSQWESLRRAGIQNLKLDKNLSIGTTSRNPSRILKNLNVPSYEALYFIVSFGPYTGRNSVKTIFFGVRILDLPSKAGPNQLFYSIREDWRVTNHRVTWVNKESGMKCLTNSKWFQIESQSLSTDVFPKKLPWNSPNFTSHQSSVPETVGSSSACAAACEAVTSSPLAWQRRGRSVQWWHHAPQGWSHRLRHWESLGVVLWRHTWGGQRGTTRSEKKMSEVLA